MHTEWESRNIISEIFYYKSNSVRIPFSFFFFFYLTFFSKIHSNCPMSNVQCIRFSEVLTFQWFNIFSRSTFSWTILFSKRAHLYGLRLKLFHEFYTFMLCCCVTYGARVRFIYFSNIILKLCATTFLYKNHHTFYSFLSNTPISPPPIYAPILNSHITSNLISSHHTNAMSVV